MSAIQTMEDRVPALTTLTDSLGRLPLEYLAIFVAFGAMGLAAFAIHAVSTAVKERKNH